MNYRNRFLAGGCLLVWAAALQIHIWQIQKYPEFDHVFGSGHRPADFRTAEETEESELQQRSEYVLNSSDR